MRKFFLDIWQTHRGTLFLYGERIAVAVIIVAVARCVIAVSGRILRKAPKTPAPVPLEPASTAPGTPGKHHFDETLAPVLRLVIRYGTVIVAAIMILDKFGFNTASLIAILGAAGVAVGLALKDTLGNIAAGIALLFLRVYRQGDYIEAGSISGTVQELGLFATTLETPDGIYISAPNSGIFGTPVKNFSRNGRRRMEIVITISWRDSIDTAFRVMRESVDAEPRFLKDPAPQMLVKSLGDSGVSLMLRAWAANENYWPLFWEQNRSIKEKMEAAGLVLGTVQKVQLLDTPR